MKKTDSVSSNLNGTFKKGFISPKRNGIFKDCQICKKTFYVSRSRIEKRGRFCSLQCRYDSWKGHIPWNSGMKGIHLSPQTEFKKGDNKGIEHHFWKGDKVGYFALHRWISTNWGKANKCERCKPSKRKKFQWANITGVYDREKENWIQLCVSCHRKEDFYNPKYPIYANKKN